MKETQRVSLFFEGGKREDNNAHRVKLRESTCSRCYYFSRHHDYGSSMDDPELSIKYINRDLFVTRGIYFIGIIGIQDSKVQKPIGLIDFLIKFSSTILLKQKKKIQSSQLYTRQRYVERYVKMRSLKEKALRKRVDVHSKARQMVAAAKCTVATGRYRADNIYVLRIQCAVSYQVIGEGREGASRAKSGTETKRRRWPGIFSRASKLPLRSH